MTEIDRIAEELKQAFNGDPWHGLPLMKTFEGLTADQAAAYPIPHVHSIWETLLHIKGWISEASHRLDGGEPGEPEGGEWPEVADKSDEAWKQAVDDLHNAHDALLAKLADTPEDRLWKTVGGATRNRAAGTGITFYRMLHGLVQHNVYHSAQIATLARLVRS